MGIEFNHLGALPLDLETFVVCRMRGREVKEMSRRKYGDIEECNYLPGGRRT